LLNPGGIAFEHIEEVEDIRIKIQNIFDTEGHLFLNKPQRYFWDIRIFVFCNNKIHKFEKNNYNIPISINVINCIS
jgi:lysine-N-methylase